MTEDFRFRKRTARMAGLWYLLMAITGPIGLLYLPNKLVIIDNAQQTVNNILASEQLFRFGILTEILCQVSFIFLAFTLYRLFKNVNQHLAGLLTGLVVASVPIAFMNLLNPLAVLVLLGKSGYSMAMDSGQVNSWVMFFLSLHEKGISLAEVFWGLWLLPFGLLVIKSGFIPKPLGVLLIVSCICYLIQSCVSIQFPQVEETVKLYVGIPEGLGEISMMLWLLTKGVSGTGAQAA